MSDIAERFPQNPLITPQQVRPSRPDLVVECVLNPGAFKLPDGRTALLARVAERPVQQADTVSFPIGNGAGAVEIRTIKRTDPKLKFDDPRVLTYDGVHYLTTRSHLMLLVSDDGVAFKEDPAFPRLFGMNEFETFGIEDCRVAHINDRWWLTFSLASVHGVGVGLRSTTDWKHFTDHGMAFTAHNKDCALFEEQIAGSYWALHRPSSPEIGGNYMWLAQSTDLIHWGAHRCIAHTRKGMWDSSRIGAGASPIRTPQGWLVLYHGANHQNRYCLGAMLLDLQQPWKVLRRSDEPIMEPLAEYEKTGFFGNVVFTNGHTIDGDAVNVYYGASDTVICGARLSITRILASLGLGA